MQLNNQEAFFALVRAGLWEKDVELACFEPFDFKEIYKLSQEQSVVGLVAAGLEHAKDTKFPKEDVLTIVGEALQLEQRNNAMNIFIGVIVEKMRKADIYTLLVKGQGVAQCYERPLLRACGDVDLFLNGCDYQKAFHFFKNHVQKIGKEDKYSKHLEISIAPWSVELHGTLRSGLWKRIDRVLDEVQKDVFYKRKVRIWINDDTHILLPGIDEDIIFIFSHILQHFFMEGVGLRQICDWCRLLWSYRDEIDRKLLENRINRMGVMSEWKAFAYLAVNTLGMSSEIMPFYSNNMKWKKKSAQILSFILETGNFGHNRDYTYFKKYPYVVKKVISLWKHIVDFGSYLAVFPADSIKVTWRRIIVGFAFVAKGK